MWEIKRFSNKTISLNKHKSSSKESINSFRNSSNKNALSKITREVKVYQESDLTGNTDKPIIQKWDELKDLMTDLTETELVPKRDYISLMLNNKTIASFNFQKNGIRLDFSRGVLRTDGNKSKNYFTLDDPKKIAKEVSWTWKGGVKGNVYKILINDKTDLDYILFLIKQKYKNLLK